MNAKTNPSDVKIKQNLKGDNSKTQPTHDKTTARPWQTYNETCISSCGNFPRFVAQTMLDDDDTKPMSQKEIAAEQKSAEANAALIVKAVNEHAALNEIAEIAAHLSTQGFYPHLSPLEAMKTALEKFNKIRK